MRRIRGSSNYHMVYNYIHGVYVRERARDIIS